VLRAEPRDQSGEVQLLAVHPDYQNHGIGTQLNLFALQKLKEGGMKLAVVGTGGDEGHARRAGRTKGRLHRPAADALLQGFVRIQISGM